MDTAVTIISGTKIHRPLMDETITKEDWEKARDELNETSDTREKRLRQFKVMILEKGEFLARTDDMYLLRFLRTKKFDVEEAYKLLRGHYKFRAEHPNCFPAPSHIEGVLRANIFNYLPHRDSMGRAIFLVNMRNWNPQVVPYDDFVAAGNMVSEYVLDNPVTQINGYIGIFDFRGFSYKHYCAFTLIRNINLLTELIQSRFPGRLKMAYCVNCPYFFKVAWILFKPFLSGKYKNRVEILSGNVDALHTYVDPCILPLEYRGSRPSWPCDDIVRLVKAKEEYFNENRNFGFQVENNQNVGV